MEFEGMIISHDPSLHTGLILPSNSEQAVPFTEGDVINWTGAHPLLGEKVSFAVVQTASGIVAFNIRLLSTRRQLLSVRRSDLVVTALAPCILAGCVYGLYHYLFWPLIIAYLASVNIVALALLVFVGASGYLNRARPTEAMLLLLAFAGGAPVLLLAIFIVPTKFSAEHIAVLLGALLLIQLIVLKREFPEVFEVDTWRVLFEQHY
jgi:uncharacterized membrane protein YsdA (DUF1294 family)